MKKIILGLIVSIAVLFAAGCEVEDAPLQTIFDNGPGSVNLISPAGGESFTSGSEAEIKWTSSQVSEVKIEFSSDAGITWEQIISATSSDTASVDWTIPDLSSSSCKVRISDVRYPLVSDTSEGLFSIANTPGITLTRPNGGENWLVGSEYFITWNSAGINDIKLQYTTNNGSDWLLIEDSLSAASGNYLWEVPGTPSSECKVKISDYTNSSLAAAGSDFFTISPPELMIIAPNGGEQWLVGTTKNITWNSSGVNNIRIEYSTNNGVNWSTITEDIAASVKSYQWMVPELPSANCLVKITDINNTSINDVTDNSFSIVTASGISMIRLEAPNGGESWLSGTSKYITWISDNISTLQISFSSDNGASWSVIKDSISAMTGHFIWGLPDLESDECLIKISDFYNPEVEDISDNPFEIVKPQIKLVSPNGGENWIVGTTKNITWSSFDVSNVRIEYSINNGSVWTTIQESYPAINSSYSWTIPGTPSNSCLVRITSHSDGTILDLSDNTFSIVGN